jgi:predicted metalloendopeptidase
MNIPGNFGKRVKCPCCSNPWDQTGTEGGSTSEGNTVCAPCMGDNKGVTGIDPENFDTSISPRDNFYLFSNGGWKAKNPIPAEYSNWNTFIALRDLNLDRLKVILEELEAASTGTVTSDDHAKLADFYNTFMDEEAIETASKESLAEVIALCSAAAADPTAAVATLHSKYGVKSLFAMYSSPDKKNSKHSLCTVTQSGLGMPDRDYYFDADKESKRVKYVEYIATMLSLLGKEAGISAYASPDDCKKAAGDAFILSDNCPRRKLCVLLSS